MDSNWSSWELELTRMGALCETAIASAVQALKDRDKTNLFRNVQSMQINEIDQAERDIERLCLKAAAYSSSL